ncbi:MFS general substrate transporter [Cylindrobasidium torrendii FP15055 ss-10]|uniref:MFS general substrate transporter n=1 Tax=Cylindrobasidium torrendii FP15055 ss-10 TaxID=1314674 RepID=A0A0D7BXG7_9AGAR|nr:MFS general substrate transporter [Cylindrobasidium torrendii FP15055 ss-10]
MAQPSPEQPRTRTPLPKSQLAATWLIQLAEPITATVIFPFAPEAIRRTGITRGDESKTGYYAGITESAFFITEALTVYFWGRASDRFGRRPILILGPLGLSFAMVGFGLSNKFWLLVLFRCLQGVFNGNIGVAKTVIAELTDDTNVGDAFAVTPFLWSVGVTIGPILGGLLANPQDRWPIFNDSPLFREHHYLLPCLAAGGLSFAIFIVSLVTLKETHPNLAKKAKPNSRTPLLQDGRPTVDYGAAGEEGHQEPAKPLRSPPLSEVATRSVMVVIGNYCLMSFNNASLDVLTPLMYSTSIPAGGLGLTPFKIGRIMFAFGVVNAVMQIGLTSFLIRRWGAPKTFTVSAFCGLLAFTAFSCESYLARLAGYIDWRVILALVVQWSFAIMISPTYGAAHVLIVHSAPSPEALATTNGLAQMLCSATRALAPTAASSLFALSLETHALGGFLVYALLIFSMTVLVWWSLMLPRVSLGK